MMGMRKLSFSQLDGRAYIELAVPDVPTDGVRIRVCYAGLCYLPTTDDSTPHRKGGGCFRNGNIFEGFEISGIVESVGKLFHSQDLVVGDPVVVFPDAEVVRQGYADFVVVRKTSNIVKLPSSVSLQTGAMLPCGGSFAMSAVMYCQKYIDQFVAEKERCNIVVFGAGSLTQWLIRILKYAYYPFAERINIIVASDDWNGLKMAQNRGADEIILLDEHCHEQTLTARLRSFMPHGVQMAVCLTQDERVQQRAVCSLGEQGVLVIPQSSDTNVTGHGDSLDSRGLQLVEVPCGTVEMLRTLISIMSHSEGLQVNRPECTVYPVEYARKFYEDLQFLDCTKRPVIDFATRCEEGTILQ